MSYRRLFGAVFLVCAALLPSPFFAQSSTPAPQQPPAAPAQQPEPAPHGKVLYQSHPDASDSAGQPQTEPHPQPAANEPQAPPSAEPQLTDADRSAIRITRYDLDIRLVPADSRLTGRAKLTVRNVSDRPLPRIALQISSTLTWQNISVQGTALPIAQHLLDTDADHTGRASELIVTLPKPLAPGETVVMDTFYAGTIAANSERLERLGASSAQALQTDWDAITPDATALRGFGNVLWFPVAAPQLFLQDGSLVPAIGRERLEHADTPVSLRLSVEYAGEAPTAAYFCGRRQPLAALHDNQDAPVAYGSGIATATFRVEPIGVRPLSLFVIAQPETFIAPLPAPVSSSSSSGTSNANGPQMLAVETTDDRALPLLADSAERVAPLVQQWLGPHPLTALTIIDHSGQPFEDGPLLLAPVGTLAASTSAPLLAHSLAHAWIQTGQPWMDEGLAEFFSLLWIEREHGRDDAVKQLDAVMQQVATADTLTDSGANATSGTASSSASQSAAVGQPLIAAYDELFFRRKAAAVWWMLRDIVGEQPLQLALSAWRTQPPSQDSAEVQAQKFEALLEKTSGKDLAWFFDDWVLHDRGLPSLSIVDVTPRELPAGAGHDKGWLVAVTVHNAGAAAAEVPLVVRSGEFATTKRIRVAGLSNTTERVIMQNPPTEVELNDGSVPEAGPSTHTRTVALHQE
ncbi:MAG TPA: M1 family aminopeptidase [Acidobacteriaceae bacterium]|nr:M1 family aminopeptidase [Acidobacteriaceae bacterium]